MTVAFKPESKKPDPRNFYIYDYDGRKTFSEFEANIASILKHKLGVSSGLSITE
jgi:hypothetical protein